ncbi:LOW QUALITY PROTEIN: hypothetical protein RJ640_003170 [Escallonia rubra]|uniref:Cytochrome P450 n=1 Tax=Escallonia rubra TaxID=112253 RepID=A0AA88REE3_9ASTE|nr:LOW QUALITY PROTEIN: hypothetical protein RJ640_003170 [Escallonia rubra]
MSSQEIFTAGTDMTTDTLEWAVVKILHNRKKLEKIELRSIVSLNMKLQKEDLDNLPYLKAIIKEKLRPHPHPPFLIPLMPWTHGLC